jgi:hypothetical protein
MRRCFALSVFAAAAFAVAALSPSRIAAVGAENAYANTCHKGYVHAVFPWGQRCLRAGEYCKKVRNPQYHRYNFQCVNGKLRHQSGKRKGTLG